MSFNQTIKTEISKQKPSKNFENIIAELLGFFVSNVNINQEYISFSSENIECMERYKYLLKKILKVEVEVNKIYQRLKKISLYSAKIEEAESLKIIKQNLIEYINVNKISDIINDLNKADFLRGIFIGNGYIANPNETYHLEISINDLNFANYINNMLNELLINSKIIMKKNQPLIYIKEAESIITYMGIIGAHVGLIHFEETRVMKEMNNNINRVINCEVANMNKTLSAAKKQIKSIEYLKKNKLYEKLNQSLKDVCEARIQNPDISLSELAEIIGISKSGLNNRITKILTMVDDHKKENGD